MAGARGVIIGLIIIIIILAGVAAYLGTQVSKPAKTITVTSTVTKTVTIGGKTVTVTKTLTTTATTAVTRTMVTTATKTVTASPKPTALKKVTLTIEYCEPFKDLFKPAIAKFIEYEKSKGYDVTVKEIMIPYGVDCSTKITQDLAAGTAGDVFTGDSFMLDSYVTAKYLYPITNFVQNWPDWSQWPKPLRDMVTFKGQVWGIMIDTDVRMLYYRMDEFKLAGIQVPWQPETWEDIIKAALTLKQNADKIKSALGISEFYPIMVPAGLKWGEATPCQGFYMLLVGADKPPYNKLYDYKNDKWVCKSTAIYRAFKFYIDIYEKYKVGDIDVNEAADPWTAHRQTFSKGIVAMDLGGSWEFYEGWGPKGIAPLPVCLQKCGCSGKCTTDEQKKCYLDCEWKTIGIAKMPGYSGGKEGEPKYVTVSGGWVVEINAKLASNPTKVQLAWDFIKILTSRDNEAQYAAKYGKVCPRLDALQVSIYSKDPYIRLIVPFLKFTNYRDALPDYPKVSKIIQIVTEKIIKGQITNADQALDMYCNMLKQVVGPNNVVYWPVRKS